MDPLTALLGTVGVATVGVVATLILKKAGFDEVDIGVNPPRFKISRKKPEPSHGGSPLPSVEPPAPTGSEIQRERDQLREAIFAYSEAAQALEALLGCKAVERDRYAREWFDSLCNGLETALRTSTEERYRASVWASRADPENFDAVGLGKFDPHDVRYQKLKRTGTIGGEAFAVTSGEKYCPDIHDPDCNWVPRSTKKSKYRSLFAVALVDLENETRRWGVLTIDCNIKDGFSKLDQQVARHFGELASLGELVWRRKEAPPV
ncbi:MAG TPA: hypothetical protein VE011_09720 [Candidatus Dormibacteraeota bacterium]|nr:hypothetical protein [Candidatus Dormibacteraeota bacterium]